MPEPEGTPQPQAQPQAQPHAPSPPQAQAPAVAKPRRKGRFSLPTHLEEVDAHYQPPQGAPDLEGEELPPQPINEEAFQQAIPELLVAFQDKSLLLATLKNAVNRSASNQWTLEVGSNLDRTILQEHRQDLTAFMRQACDNPTIKMVIEVNEQAAKERMAQQPRTLTPQQRLDQMRAENPHLDTLIQTFKAIQEYS